MLDVYRIHMSLHDTAMLLHVLEPGARTKQYMSDPEYKTTCFLYLPAIVSAAISGPPEGRGMMWHVYGWLVLLLLFDLQKMLRNQSLDFGFSILTCLLFPELWLAPARLTQKQPRTF